MLLSTGVQAFAGTSLDTALNKVNLYAKGSQGAQLLTWKGAVDPHNFAATIIVYRAEDGIPRLLRQSKQARRGKPCGEKL